jgi:hypothetical protein
MAGPSLKPVSPSFKIVLATVMVLTAISLIVCVACAFSSNNCTRVGQLFDMCRDSWKYGTGAIFGLLAGKNL